MQHRRKVLGQSVDELRRFRKSVFPMAVLHCPILSSTKHLLEIAERVKAKGADLHILNLGADTSTATGKLMFTVIGAIACFERELMLERQREGIAKAKAEGKYRGRKPTARAKADEIKTLKAAGIRPTDIARRLGIGRASVYRVLGNAI